MKEQKDFLYKTAFEETVDAIIITDGTTGKVLEANKSSCYLLNCEKENLIGQNFFDLFEQDSVFDSSKSPKEISMFGSVLPNRKLKTSEGKLIPVDLTINTFNGTSSHLVMTSMRDARERVKYEEQILKMNEELKELNASKDKLFSIIAHDLKNPMMAMMGLSEFLTEGDSEVTPTEISEMANSINKLSKDTYELLDNLLSWAQVQTDRIEPHKQVFNLSDTISKVVEVLNPSAELKGVKLVNMVEAEKTINADENMIRTIIRNLISNSIKFSLENTSIAVKLLETDKRNIIIVEDQGVGMEEEYVKNLFRIDVQTTRPGTKKEKGTGLGLLICNEFAKLHDGEIKVASEVGKGSEFFIHLPK